MRYRKRPVVIDAHPVADVIERWTRGNVAMLPDWVNSAVQGDLIDFPRVNGVPMLRVQTLEGSHMRRDGMLIRGVQGELYGCEQGIFDETYDVEDGS